MEPIPGCYVYENTDDGSVFVEWAIPPRQLTSTDDTTHVINTFWDTAGIANNITPAESEQGFKAVTNRQFDQTQNYRLRHSYNSSNQTAFVTCVVKPETVVASDFPQQMGIAVAFLIAAQIIFSFRIKR